MIDSAAIAKAREALSLVETYLPYGRHSVKMLSDFINEVEAAMKAEPADYQIQLFNDRWTHCAPHIYEACVKENPERARKLYVTPLAQQRPPHDQKFYKPCDKHKDLPFTLHLKYTPPFQTVCPHCEKEPS